MNRVDLLLYCLIGGLGSAQTFVAAGQLPSWLAPWIGIPLAVLTVWKAKRSPGRDATPKDGVE